MITIFYVLTVAPFLWKNNNNRAEKHLDGFKGEIWLGVVVSARFTVWSLFCEMASSDRLRVVQIFQWLFSKVIIVAQISRVVYIS